MPLVQEKTRKPAVTCERKPLGRNEKWVGRISQIIWLKVLKSGRVGFVQFTYEKAVRISLSHIKRGPIRGFTFINSCFRALQ